jgi:hypothetical protein
MDDLIKALQIFRRYANHYAPIHCEHDVLVIAGISPDVVSQEDKDTLDELGFFVNQDEGQFNSFRFGSA